MSHRLLLIGLGPQAQETIVAAANLSGHSLRNCGTGVEATKILGSADSPSAPAVDLAILDQQLPDMSALTWLNMIRQTAAGKGISILVLGAKNCQESEIVQAFDSGADDFIQMPCQPQEVAARIRAVLRRRFDREESHEPALEMGPVSIDPGGRQCRVRGKIVSLRPREFELLQILMSKAGRTLSRPYLLEVIWGMDKSATTRAVDVGISRLRQALGGRAGRWIETVERYGYRFRIPED